MSELIYWSFSKPNKLAPTKEEEFYARNEGVYQCKSGLYGAHNLFSILSKGKRYRYKFMR